MTKTTQHGFHSKRSCLTNLIDFYNDVFNIYGQTKTTDLINLYFQKAFDKVPKKRLLKKTCKILKWLED